MSFKKDLFESNTSFKVEEAKEVNSNNHILAKVKGEFFFPNGKSRNGRFYPAKLWDNALLNKEVQERLKNKTMFGSVGHNVEITDETIGEGKISHFMTSLYIENGKGMGEAFILNTPAGRVLNTLIRAGSKMCTSSRADGDFKGETHEGLEVVDEDSYVLHGFDFVVDPGFINAIPQISESLKKDIKFLFDKEESNTDGGKRMSLELVQKLSEEKARTQLSLDAALDENKKLIKEMAKIQAELEVKEQSLLESKKIKEEEMAGVDAADKKVKELEKAVDDLNAELKDYKEFGDLKDLDMDLKKVESLSLKMKASLKAYEKLGTVKAIEVALEKATATIKEYKEIGEVADLKKALVMSERLTGRIKEEEEVKEIEALSIELEIPAEKIEILKDKGLSSDEIKDIFDDIEVKTEMDAEGEDFEDEEEGEDDQEDFSQMDQYSLEDEDFEDEEDEEEELSPYEAMKKKKMKKPVAKKGKKKIESAKVTTSRRSSLYESFKVRK
jgi:hypothetical protein